MGNGENQNWSRYAAMRVVAMLFCCFCCDEYIVHCVSEHVTNNLVNASFISFSNNIITCFTTTTHPSPPFILFISMCCDQLDEWLDKWLLTNATTACAQYTSIYNNIIIYDHVGTLHQSTHWRHLLALRSSLFWRSQSLCSCGWFRVPFPSRWECQAHAIQLCTNLDATGTHRFVYPSRQWCRAR